MSDIKYALDDICDTIDHKVRAGKLNDLDTRASFMETMVSSDHKPFARRYLEASLEYHTSKNEIAGSGKGLGHGIRDMDLSRVFCNTVLGGFAGGLVGSRLGDKPTYAAIGAVAGAALTVSDEMSRTGVDLGYTFWGTILGAWVGDSYVGAQAGAAIGGGLGLLKAGADAFIKSGKKQKNVKAKLANLESGYVARRTHLIEDAERALLENGESVRRIGSAKHVAERN